MGVRGEIFSSRVILPNRTYFFNVKENRMGDLYLNIVESKNKETGGFDRQSVILFADDLQEFLRGFEESLKVMEKAVREKRHSGSVTKREEKSAPRDRGGNRQKFSGERPAKNRRPDHRQEHRSDHRDHRSDQRSDRRSDHRSDHKPNQRHDGRRVVVKKHDRGNF